MFTYLCGWFWYIYIYMKFNNVQFAKNFDNFTIRLNVFNLKDLWRQCVLIVCQNAYLMRSNLEVQHWQRDISAITWGLCDLCFVCWLCLIFSIKNVLNKSFLNAFFLELLVHLGGSSYCYSCYSGVHFPFSFWLYALDLFQMQYLSYY